VAPARRTRKKGPRRLLGCASCGIDGMAAKFYETFACG
jgi:hypothetical protein